MTALNRKLIRDLRHLSGQVLAVVLVIASGIAIFVTMRSTYESLTITLDRYYEQFRFADVFVSLKRAPNSILPAIVQIPGVAALEARLVYEVTLDLPRMEEPAIGRIVSLPDTRNPALNDVFIRSGRTIDPYARNEILISEAFAEAHSLRCGDSIRAILNGRAQRLQIVGIALSPEYVYEIRGGEVLPDNRRFGVIWMGYKVLASVFRMEGAFNDVVLKLSDKSREPGVIVALDRLLEEYGGLGAYGRQDQISHFFLSEEIEETKVNGTVIPAIFLAVAAFLIHIVLSRQVGIQRGQIAVLKSFGYGNGAIAFHYLKFGLAAVMVGAVLGIIAGVWLASGLAVIYQRFFRFPLMEFTVSWQWISVSVGISAAAAMLGAVVAVRDAVSLPPAEAMRPEPPAHFHGGLIERLRLQRYFSISVRMIVRNLERRPVKALLSVVGIALAVAILMVGRYVIDAIDHILVVQFEKVQREDVVVWFENPKSPAVAHSLAQLAGVERSEPFRSVPVRLRYEHRTRRVGLTGIDPDADLRRLVDRNLLTVRIPPEGVILSKTLAQSLGVTEGDDITVEVLEGARQTRSVPVSGRLDDLVGVAAYMDLSALHRLLQEGDIVSGAYLAVDPIQASRLYAQLKQTPAISGIGIRSAMLKSFQDTIAESFNIATYILIWFACIIALGMVYNSARIALSERGHELASLRVLGFTGNEVAFMLLGEQAMLTLFAIPVGYGIGFALCALVANWKKSELFRLPLVVSTETLVFSCVAVLVAACLSSLIVLRRIRHLDLVEVLKTRE